MKDTKDTKGEHAEHQKYASDANAYGAPGHAIERPVLWDFA